MACVCVNPVNSGLTRQTRQYRLIQIHHRLAIQAAQSAQVSGVQHLVALCVDLSSVEHRRRLAAQRVVDRRQMIAHAAHR